MTAESDSLEKARERSFGSALSAGTDARNAALLINAGAAIATLTFLGHLVGTAGATKLLRPGSVALVVFACGTLFAAMASGTTYMAQSARTNMLNAIGSDPEPTRDPGAPWRTGSVVLIVLAYLAFAAGCFIGACALSSF